MMNKVTYVLDQKNNATKKLQEDDKMEELIKKGLEQGFVNIIQSPNDDCIACRIGEYWFYFIGNEDENKTPEEILSSYPKDELCALIQCTIKELNIDEQLYYQYYLEEHMKSSECRFKNDNCRNIRKRMYYFLNKLKIKERK